MTRKVNIAQAKLTRCHGTRHRTAAKSVGPAPRNAPVRLTGDGACDTLWPPGNYRPSTSQNSELSSVEPSAGIELPRVIPQELLPSAFGHVPAEHEAGGLREMAFAVRVVGGVH